MKLRAALLMTAALALAPALASAETYEGWYGSIGGAYNGLRDSDISGARTGKAEWSAGYGAIGALGYSFGATPLRLEGELGYRRNNLDSVSGLAPAALNGSGSGHVSAYTGMLNLLWDIMPAQRFTPYVGAGMGVASLHFDNLRGANGGSITDDSDAAFAYQGIIGASYAITPTILLNLDYRYLGTTDAKGLSGPTGPVEIEYNTHTVLAGVTFRFGAPPPPAPAPVAAPVARPAAPPPPPPPPPPAPAPAPVAAVPQTYIVFFAFDRSDISPVAAQVLDRAIADYRATGSTRIVVQGHTDRSGSDKYNQKLSERRAANVASYLGGHGIAAGNISQEAFGESRPRVPTADGIRNDENRRAEIFLRK